MPHGKAAMEDVRRSSMAAHIGGDKSKPGVCFAKLSGGSEREEAVQKRERAHCFFSYAGHQNFKRLWLQGRLLPFMPAPHQAQAAIRLQGILPHY